MNEIKTELLGRIQANRDKPGFLEALFRERKKEALSGTPVVLFGAGGLGQELNEALQTNGVSPICFCDNNPARVGASYCGLPVISFKDLKQTQRKSMVVIASQKFRDVLSRQLLENGFDESRVFCKTSDTETPFVFMYSMVGTQCLLSGYRKASAPRSVLDTLLEREQDIVDAYEVLADERSKQLLLSKLALIASDGNFELFKEFLSSHSQPLRDFGWGNYDGTPEDHYYFNNDVLRLLPDEVYVDVGAYDGDTVHSFVQACGRCGLRYERIHAFEPDPQCYQALVKNTATYTNLSCYKLGVWSGASTLSFKSSDTVMHDQAGVIDEEGNIRIEVIGLDDFLKRERVTFIKMDPGGNVIPEALEGAADIIRRHKPKLALGAYHTLMSIVEIPLQVRALCPDYTISLRHSTFHLCDTDLYATV